MDALILSEERPDNTDVRALLQRHFDLMRSQSPAESCHVMPPDTIADAGVSLLGLRRDGVLVGIGALAVIAPGEGELKSMHTAAEARGQGIARKIVRTLLDRATTLGLSRVNLETGTAPVFAPARALYASEGFETCPPFGSYVIDPLSTYMTKAL